MIHLLDETTVAVIAAGEVVERPLSVVKELVENALDAQARRITVAVTQGGLSSIEVADDGSGIPRADLQLAFARHATSKLTRSADLERIATLGFRGEGLASISAVARVRLCSRIARDDVGYVVVAHGLDVSQPEPYSAPPGTRVTVEALFANVPVRRDYLRMPSAEFARVSTFLAMLALGYPNVAFSLTHDGRTAFTFPAADALDQRLAHVFGSTQAQALVALDERDGLELRVRGFVSTPGADRADRRMQLLFVNGRLLRSNIVTGAWSAGYATYTMSGRHPFGVLFVDAPPDWIDPNVHPTKSDVRLRYPERVVDAVRRTITRTLARHATTRLSDALSFAPPLQGGAGDSPDDRAAPVLLDWAAGPRSLASEKTGDVPPGELRILAQLDDTFVLATDGRALVLVDQHAAHERVAFETIATRARNGSAPHEPLLIPYAIELSAQDAVRFESARPALVAAGLDVEPFGDRTYRIVATPAGYGARAFDWRACVADLGDEVAGLNAQERVWASLACHSVVRAGERLEHAEMSALLARLVRCANPMHCPHGRPTLVRIEADAVARMFKRA